jgi:hypothetical protein
VDTSRATQLTLVLGGFFGKDVALERLTALDAATGADNKAFLRTALGFHLWHNNSILFDDAGRFLTGTLENPEPLIWDSFLLPPQRQVPCSVAIQNHFFLGPITITI